MKPDILRAILAVDQFDVAAAIASGYLNMTPPANLPARQVMAQVSDQDTDFADGCMRAASGGLRS